VEGAAAVEGAAVREGVATASAERAKATAEKKTERDTAATARAENAADVSTGVMAKAKAEVASRNWATALPKFMRNKTNKLPQERYKSFESSQPSSDQRGDGANPISNRNLSSWGSKKSRVYPTNGGKKNKTKRKCSQNGCKNNTKSRGKNKGSKNKTKKESPISLKNKLASW
jgi:hypothetical protein